MISWWVVDCQWPFDHSSKHPPFLHDLPPWRYTNPAGFQLQDPGDGNPVWLDATRHLKGGTHAELVIVKGFWVNWDSLNWSPNLTFGLGCLYLGDEVSVFFVEVPWLAIQVKTSYLHRIPLGAKKQMPMDRGHSSHKAVHAFASWQLWDLWTPISRQEEEHCLVHRNGYFQK